MKRLIHRLLPRPDHRPRLAPRRPTCRRPRRTGLETLERRAMLSWTVMVYVDGDNNLEGAAIDDFLEMASIGSTAGVNIVVQMDRIGGYDTRYGDWTGTRRGLVEQGDTPTAAWGTGLGEVNMGDRGSVVEFVNWSMANYAADNYALVLWNHGGGLSGVCWDDTSGDHLSVEDLGLIGDSLPALDLIGFDACLMGMVEVGYQLSGEAEVMVGSEDLEPGDGWEYQNFLDDLTANAGMTAAQLGEAIVASYAARYAADTAVSLSSIDLTALGTASTGLVGALNSFATTVLGEASQQDWTVLEAALYDVQWFADTWYYDVAHLMEYVGGLSQTTPIVTASQNVLTALQATVLDNFHSSDLLASGLSIYLATPSYDAGGWAMYDASFDFVADTAWKTMLAAIEIGSAGGGGDDSGDDSGGDDGGGIGGDAPGELPTAAPVIDEMQLTSETLPYREVLLDVFFDDADAIDAFQVTIDWGDGSPLATGVAWSWDSATGEYLSSAAHVFAACGEFTVTVTITDQAGLSVSRSDQALVAPVVLAPDDDGTGLPALLIQGTDAAETFFLSYNAAAAQVYVETSAWGGYQGTFTLPATSTVYLWAAGGDDTVDLQTSDFPLDAVVWGEAGDDTLLGGRGNDVLYGEEGADVLEGFYGNDFLCGGAGNDFLFGYHGNDSLYGDEGNDYLHGQQHDDYVDGGAGHDRLMGQHGNDTLEGGDGRDRVIGGIGDDLLRGGALNDYLFGNDGNDILIGNDGNDHVYGHAGRDLLIGSRGADTLMGHGSDDILIGGETLYDAPADPWLDGILNQVRALWIAEQTIHVRMATLVGGAGDGLLDKGTQVLDDHAADHVLGNAGADWLFAFSGDLLVTGGGDRVG